MAKRVKGTVSVDDQLTGHLKRAEEELIGAVNLFADHQKLERRTGYLTRLARAQELVTGLHREELVRIRGPQRRRAK